MNQAKKDKLLQGGYSGSIPDMSYQYFKTQVGSAGTHQDLENKFLVSNGYSQGSLADRWKQYFTAQGITGPNQQSQVQWWKTKTP
jgi:hypothetical protein